MRKFACMISAATVMWSSQVFAQDEQVTACTVPYTVEEQATLEEAYASVTLKIANVLPIGEFDDPSIRAFRSAVNGIIGGEAQQAMTQVSKAYFGCLRANLPASKHDHLDLI